MVGGNWTRRVFPKNRTAKDAMQHFRRATHHGSMLSFRQRGADLVVKDDCMDGIPVVDIAKFRHGDAFEQKRIADDVARAVETIGFLSVVGHGVPQTVIDRVRESAWTYFNQPLAEKQACLHPSRNLNRGYTPFAEEHNAASAGNGSAADLREGFIFGPLELPDGIEADTAAAHAYQPNIWPDSLPGVSEAFQTYYTAVADFNKILLEVFATALNLPAPYFEEEFRGHSSTVRILHYPRSGRRTGRRPASLWRAYGLWISYSSSGR